MRKLKPGLRRTDLIGRNVESAIWDLEIARNKTIEERARVLFDLIESVRLMNSATKLLRR